MRNYGIVMSTFWTGETGRKIRELGGDAQLVACYLMTAPFSHMTGLYYLPQSAIAHDIALKDVRVADALLGLHQVEFASYDLRREFVWVHEMAKFQIAETLRVGDKRIASIVKHLVANKKVPFAREVYEKYRVPFNLPDTPELGSPSQAPPKPLRRASEAPPKGLQWVAAAGSASPFDAPSMPLRSQEQEQEQDQKQDQELHNACKGEAEATASGPVAYNQEGQGPNGERAFAKLMDSWTKEALRRLKMLEQDAAADPGYEPFNLTKLVARLKQAEPRLTDEEARELAISRRRAERERA